MLIGDKAKKTIKNAINTVADAVKETFGGGGKTVVIPNVFNAGYLITKDGVSVAKAVSTDDEYENIIISLVRDSSIKTNNDVGDGTTTSAVLTQAIYNSVDKQREYGRNINALLKGVERGTKNVLEKLKESSKEIKQKDLKSVATISANNDEELGSIIAEAYEKVGKDGVVSVEASESSKSYLELINGMTFDGDVISRAFSSNSSLENPLIMIVNYKIERIQEIGNILSGIDKRPVVIVCDDMSFDVQDVLQQNQNVLKTSVIKTNVYGDKKNQLYEDLSKYLGSKLFSVEEGIPVEKGTIEDLGSCDRITSQNGKTLVIGGKGENIEEYISYISAQKGTGLSSRIASLRGEVAVIKLGASTKTEFDEKIDRVEDSINATKASLLEGIVPGGGIALLKIGEEFLRQKSYITDEEVGEKCLYEAIKEPSKCILSNAGFSDRIIEEIENEKFPIGWDVTSNSKKDFYKAGIVDPVKVTRIALENSSSVARTLLNTNVIIN